MILQLPEQFFFLLLGKFEMTVTKSVFLSTTLTTAVWYMSEGRLFFFLPFTANLVKDDAKVKLAISVVRTTWISQLGKTVLATYKEVLFGVIHVEEFSLSNATVFQGLAPAFTGSQNLMTIGGNEYRAGWSCMFGLKRLGFENLTPRLKPGLKTTLGRLLF